MSEFTFETVKADLKRMDPKLSETDESYQIAAVLLASAALGPDADRIAKFTGYSRDWVRKLSTRLRGQGIWKGGRVYAEWQDPENGGAAFWLDVCVGRGFMDRVPA